MRRLFVGLELPTSIHGQVVEIQARLQAVASLQGVRFVPHAKLVIPILQFDATQLNPEEDSALLQESFAGTSFSIGYRHLAGAPSLQRPKEIFLELHGDLTAIEILQGQISAELAESTKPEPMQPRILLARVSPGSKRVGFLTQGLGTELDLEANAPEWAVEELVLFENLASGEFLPRARIGLGPAS